MKSPPQFPDFKVLELKDQEFLHQVFWQYQPQASEWTFNNQYIWWSFYKFKWSMYQDWLLMLCEPFDDHMHLLQPLGPTGRKQVVLDSLDWLKTEMGVKTPFINKADQRLIDELKNEPEFQIEELRDHFDYVYRAEDLIHLKGRKYHKKRNHLNRFSKQYQFEYRPMTQEIIPDCVDVLKKWCDKKECEKSPRLHAEFEAVYESLLNFDVLHMTGGVIRINDQIEAFAMGEMLNEETAVIHVEKADPKIPEVFTLINQQFATNAWSHAKYINREQDLGAEGLRKAKLSYYPIHMEKKYKISRNLNAK